MGRKSKYKKAKVIKRLCATSALHDAFKVGENTQLMHERKIKVCTKRTLLGRIGKSIDYFKGSICTACIDSVEAGTAHLHDAVLPHRLDEARMEDMLLSTGFSKDEAATDNEYSVGVDIDSENEFDLMEYIDSTDDRNCDFSQVDINGMNTSSPLSPLVPGTESNTDPVIILSLTNLKQDLDELTPEVRSQLAYELAAGERARIRADTLSVMHGDNRDINALHNICRVEYLQERNKVLVHFVTGLWAKPSSQIDRESPHVHKRSEIYKLAKAIESCMGLTSPVAVLPFHFREIVLLYSHTRSRTALSLMSSSAPHGCYQTVKNWLNKLGESEFGGTMLSSDKGDALCVFDNNQVLQRRWNICVDNRAVCSVITMVIFLDIDTEGTLQFQEELKPSHWMWETLDEQKLAKLREGHLNAVHQETKYVKHFHPWLTDIIQQVADEQTLLAGKCVDEVDKRVASKKHEKDFRSCPKCGSTTIPRRKRKCPSCTTALPTIQTNAAKRTPKQSDKGKEGETRVLVDRRDDDTYSITYESTTRKSSEYDHLPEQHPEVPPGVIIGEPLSLNPCSYEAVAEVFRKIGRQAGVRKYGGTREWLSIVCDGLPYILGYQLIERTFLCQLCGKSVQGLSERISHQEEHEKKEPGSLCNYSQEFDWVLLQPGPGHVEMNMLKTFVKFAWPVFWEGMVDLFNFKSEIAKRSARSVNDHHKGMTLAKIARESMAKELVLPYVRQQLVKEDRQLSAAGFLQFLKTVKSPNHHLMSDLVFVILDAIFLYRAGLRCGDVAMIDAGRAIFARMWCAQSHPLYRQLSVYDSIMTACMPSPVLELNNKTKSFNLTGVPYSGEGADFKLEAVNKSVQHWVPSNPTDRDWKHACANQPKLSKLKQTAESDMHVKDPRARSVKSSADLQPEIMAFRTTIREREFVSNHDTIQPLKSYDNEPLDADLAKFAKTAGRKELAFLNSFLNHKKSGGFLERSSIRFDEAPIFVTPQERVEYDDIRNKTVNECTRIIQEKILEIENEEMRKNFAKAFEIEIVSRKGKKQDYLDFYELLKEYELMSSRDTDGTDDTDAPDATNTNEATS